MSHIAILARHPRRSLTALATLVAAGAVVIGSGAVFSTQTANPSNTLASGILSQTNSNSGSAILTMNDIIPGQQLLGHRGYQEHRERPGDLHPGRERPALPGLDQRLDRQRHGPYGEQAGDQLQLVIQDCGAFSGP